MVKNIKQKLYIPVKNWHDICTIIDISNCSVGKRLILSPFHMIIF